MSAKGNDMTTPEENYDWWLGQIELREKYAGQVVILHDRTVLGAGEHHQAALDNARRLAEEQGRTLPDRDLLFLAAPEVVWYPPEPAFEWKPRPWNGS